MAHQRQSIRQAIRDLLIDKTAAGKNVDTSRVRHYRMSDLPAISVYTSNEEVDPNSINTAPRVLTRKLEATIQGWVKFGAGMDDAMDELALQIETAMHADPYFGGAAIDSVYAGFTAEVEVGGDAEIGYVSLTYQVTYETLAPEAPTELDDFERVTATHELEGGVGDTVPAVDDFTVEAP